MPEDQAGSDFVDESKRKMGLLRLGRSRWSPSESSKRSMGLLRLGRGGDDASEDDKRSMQLLRLGRKRDGDEDFVVDPDVLDDQTRPRSVVVYQ